MCDDHVLVNEAASRRRLSMTRREFNLLALSAAAVALLPTRADALDVASSMVKVKTPDGNADCYLAHPKVGRHPGVILWPDFMSLRPAYRQMADRLAQSGYSVLVINQYYRDAKSPLMEKADFDNEPVMKKIFDLAGKLTVERINMDARAFVAFLDKHGSVDARRKIGTVGYCISGRYAFQTAAVAADRVGAVAAFHAGGLVSDKPSSPHRLIASMKARALIGIAADDDQREAQTKDVLREAFAQADLPAEIEVYANTVHGWCTPDMTAYYHEAQAQRAWSRMLALFEAHWLERARRRTIVIDVSASACRRMASDRFAHESPLVRECVTWGRYT